MSVTGLSPGQDRLFRKTLRHSTDSDELDVFEASRYFSGEPPAAAPNGGDYWNGASSCGRRISLDMPGMRNHRQSLFSSSHHAAAEPKQAHKEKKHKQPSSPGGRIASFLNSLFAQSAGKKKKTGGGAATSAVDDGRRKRRSSISHFPMNPDRNDAVFAAPAVTPTKIAFRSLSDHKQTVSPLTTTKNPEEKSKSKLKLRPTNEEPINLTNTINNNKNRGSDRNRPVFDLNDGGESDSSSDLFELRNYDLIDYSNELPVYETTRMEGVGAPISVHGR